MLRRAEARYSRSCPCLEGTHVCPLGLQCPGLGSRTPESSCESWALVLLLQNSCCEDGGQCLIAPCGYWAGKQQPCLAAGVTATSMLSPWNSTLPPVSVLQTGITGAWLVAPSFPRPVCPEHFWPLYVDRASSSHSSGKMLMCSQRRHVNRNWALTGAVSCPHKPTELESIKSFLCVR